MSYLRVTLSRLFSRPAERDLLEDRHVILDDAGLADHDTRCVIEEYPGAQARSGMNVDLQGARCAPLKVKRDLATVGHPKRVCKTVDLNREKALRMKKDVERLGRSGIALEHCR